MLKSAKLWKMKDSNYEAIQHLAKEIPSSELVAHLLYNRGLTEPHSARSFLHSETVPYHDPFLLKGMEEAVERLTAALENEEKILVFGDYDADGVTSTSLLVLALRELGGLVSYYIPDRFREGYGPNIPAIERAKDQGVSLIVTVDTGISAVDVAKRAKEIGLDYIVTDHHEPPPVLPAAYAIINPKQPGCSYPFKGLAGVGVAFKLVHALMEEIPAHLLDLAAVGTISDLVPLIDENRRLVKEGLHVLSHHPKPGLHALLNVSGQTDLAKIDSDVVGFQLGPRLNAAGRLEHASISAELLMAEDPRAALELAEQVNTLNEERKNLVEQIAKQAIAMVAATPNEERDFIIVAGENWHEGVLGIVASRLVEAYYRPTLVLSIHPETGMAKGSARSIEGFDLFQGLSTCRDILPHFGGHEMAAGLSLPKEQVEELRERMNRYARQILTAELLVPKLTVDAEVPIQEVSLSLIEEIAKLEPYGVGNPKPKFTIKQVVIKDMKQIGADKNHLKMTLSDKEETLEGISFRNGHLFHEMTSEAHLSVVGELSINEWNGFRKPQIFIEDFQIEQWQLFDWRGQDHWLKAFQEVDKQACTLIYFQKETPNRLGTDFSKAIYYKDLLADSGEMKAYLVLLDLPDSLDQLSHLFSHLPFPQRVYTIFDQATDHFFENMPSREHFKQVFQLFHKHQDVTVEKLRAWAKYKGWSISRMDFIINVFLDLEFVRIEKDVLLPIPSSTKKPLTESPTYQKRLAQTEVEEVLLFSSRPSLREWFNQVKADRTVSKEDILS